MWEELEMLDELVHKQAITAPILPSHLEIGHIGPSGRPQVCR